MHVYVNTCAHLHNVFYALPLYAFLRSVLVVENLCTGLDDSTMLQAFWNLPKLTGASVPRTFRKKRGKQKEDKLVGLKTVRLYFSNEEDASTALRLVNCDKEI